MTREEAIEYWEGLRKSFSSQLEKEQNHFGRMHLQTTIDALDMAISALRQQETVTNRNGLTEPLTLEELRKMSGEPVFVVTDRLKEWCIVHSHNSDDVIGGGIIMTRRTAEKRIYPYDCYGKTWLAYRQKPEEGTV